MPAAGIATSRVVLRTMPDGRGTSVSLFSLDTDMAREKTRASLYRAIASRLSDDIKAMTGSRLPSQRSLYLRYGVSQATLKAAIRVLEEQGIVETGAPGRVRICGRVEAPPAERLTAEETVCRYIRSGMVQAKYCNGQSLPKMAALAAELAVSTHSVLRAYHRMGRQGLLHRRGKSWVVGLPDVKIVNRPWKTVLVLTHRPPSWNGLDASPRTRGFCMAFSREAQMHKTLMITASCGLGKDRVPSFLSGTEAVMRKIDELGAEFTGMLVAASRKQAPELEMYIQHLHRLRRPLVWFDAYNEGCAELSVPRSDKRRVTPWFTRCHFDEIAAVDLALRRLVDAGHRTIGYVCHGREWWMQHRLELLRDAARRCGQRAGCEVHIVAHPLESLLHSLNDLRQTGLALEQILREDLPVAPGVLRQVLRRVKGGRHSRSERWALDQVAGAIVAGSQRPGTITQEETHVLTYASLFGPYLRNPGITALIAPNDSKAYLYYRHLSRLTVAVPGKYSLISFDNYVPDQPSYPITTVDFGFDSLGYAAFHAIMGDLPTARNAQGDIAAMPRLVERGSVEALQPRLT